MAYAQFDPTKPDAATQNGTAFAQSARDNLKVIRDAAIMGGGFYGWNMAASGGTADQPATITYSKGSERVRAALTWGTAGGQAGSVTVAVYSYSSNSGTSWDAIGTKTITYDSTGNVTSTSWS
jgi:hypothetical protein